MEAKRREEELGPLLLLPSFKPKNRCQEGEEGGGGGVGSQVFLFQTLRRSPTAADGRRSPFLPLFPPLSATLTNHLFPLLSVGGGGERRGTLKSRL